LNFSINKNLQDKWEVFVESGPTSKALFAN